MFQKDDLEDNSNLPIKGKLSPEYLLHERYRIITFLEEKRGANIYRAIDEVTNLIVILKERVIGNVYQSKIHDVDADNFSDELSKNPWFDEFVILRSVRYPTVVKAVDIFSEGDLHYIVVEQLEGNDLKYFITKNKVTIQQSCDWLIQLCQSISQLHRRNIVHLDLQPRYIVVTKDWQRVRLTGFDFAWQLPVKSKRKEDISISDFSAPEIVTGNNEPDHRSDIYSLGLIWHHILTGYLPNGEEKNKDDFLPELVDFIPQVSPHLNRIIAKMIHPEPEWRFQSVDEVKLAILELYTSVLYSVGYCTDVGKVREANEDSFSVQNKRYISQYQQLNYGIFIVADGMGGAKAGEYASALATKEVSAYINHYFEDLENKKFSEIELKTIMEQAVKRANTLIYQQSKENKAYSGMGTTVTAALIYGGQCYIAHVGDSRAYLINHNGIERVSRDHSLVGRLLEIGQITPEEAAVHPQRNLIYRSLGGFPAVEVDNYQLPIRSNDHLLLCSDGLYEYVRDEEIQSIVLSANEPDEACRHLINLTNSRGGDDNTTVIIIKIAEIN